MDQNQEVMVIFILEKEVVLAFRNAFVKSKAILSRYNGRIVGYCDQVQVLEGNWTKKSTLAAAKFATYRECKMWLESDVIFRQNDFLGHVDIWIVPLNRQNMSHKGYPVMVLMNQYVTIPSVFEEYNTKEKESVPKFGGVARVVETAKPHKWRGVTPPGFVIINQFPSNEILDKYVASADNKVSSELRKQASSGFVIACELNIDI